jgi:hypothetical protein
MLQVGEWNPRRAREDRPMTTTRRDFLTAAVTAAGAAVTPEIAHSGSTHDRDHQVVPSDPTLGVKALESLLVEKGLVDPAALDVLVDAFEHKLGPRNGAACRRARVGQCSLQGEIAERRTAAIAELVFASHQGERIVEQSRLTAPIRRTSSKPFPDVTATGHGNVANRR